MAYPSFSAGEVLTAADMNAVGLWLIKTQTVGSAVSSVQVTGAFSSTYNNYIITWVDGTVSANSDIGIQLGASTTGYYQFLNYGQSNTSTPLGAGRNNQVNFAWIGGGTAGQAGHARVEVFGPNLARYTKFLGGAYQNDNIYGTTVGEHRVATAYTDFTLAPGIGTMTGGTIRVYGYKNGLS
jgi:hypothetical protein